MLGRQDIGGVSPNGDELTLYIIWVWFMARAETCKRAPLRVYPQGAVCTPGLEGAWAKGGRRGGGTIVLIGEGMRYSWVEK